MFRQAMQERATLILHRLFWRDPFLAVALLPDMHARITTRLKGRKAQEPAARFRVENPGLMARIDRARADMLSKFSS